MSVQQTKQRHALGLIAALLPSLIQATLGQGLLTQYSASLQFPLEPPTLDVSCPLPVDDRVGNGSVASTSLWTHQPKCEFSKGATKKYCAYTNSQHGPRGWSIVTKPETAADSASFLNYPLNMTWPADNNTQGTAAAPYKLVDIPGRGVGVVATRHIKQYEEIMLDYATVLVDIMFTTEVSAFLGYRLLHAAVDQLADPDSVLALEQSNGYARDKVENILRTNAFNTPLGGVPHIALYPLVSRINHGCNPNAYTRFKHEALQLSIGALRDIAEGEEITHSYIPLGLTSAERAQKLRPWGFTCTCSLCTAPPDELAASDARRRELQQLNGAARSAFQAGRPYEALRLTRQILARLPREDLLFGLGSEQYENLARVYYVLGERAEARRYVRKALEIRVEQGYDEGPVGEREVEGVLRRFAEEEGVRY
ncbi:hypothetical protein B0J18DRAFT_459495 [Chaetomium sp. MPI-SDFR-AT-0129]|nr:hypothetical protein B0J18DRAFT_459495 [Chaetomium sp. MPI-SDFR-AT-0129]